jgi:hypothetical protein
MDLIFHQNENGLIAELQSGTVLAETQDFLDLIANAGYRGAEKMIIHKHNLPDGFFNLKTRLAGEVLQKFSTYNQKLAIVGDFSAYNSKSLHDFIRESNRVKRIVFVSTVDEAFGIL